MTSKIEQERGFKWWLRYVIVPIIGSGGIIAIIVAVITNLSSPSQQQYVGRIINSDTGKPIHGAKVSLEFQNAPPVVYTDSEGIFRFSLDSTGSNPTGRVKVEAAEYQPYDRFITLSSKNTSLEDIRLKPLSSTSDPSPIPPPTPTPSPLVDLAGTYAGTFSTNSTRFRGTYNAILIIPEDGTGTLTVQGATFYNATVNVQVTTQTTVTIAFNDVEGDRIEATLAREGNKLQGSWKYATGNLQDSATGEIDVSKAN